VHSGQSNLKGPARMHFLVCSLTVSLQKEKDTIMGFALVDITKSTRGKNAHPITFQGIGKYVETPVKDDDGNATGEVERELVTNGVLTSTDEALELVGGNVQTLLDFFAKGFNEDAYRQVADADELDPYVVGLEAKDADAVKRAIRAVAKGTGLELTDAAEIVIASRQSVMAKKAEKEAVATE
jgi:hypothetical protein